jgi:glycosyltransferase involved in cell wall biosynthesis
MEHNARISVLMPVYNSEKHIAEAIQSILNQTFTDYEFIIINDGSTDKTVEIIREYDDPRIKLIDNTKNQGLIAVLNQGIDLAQGEYIARMDADDISLPTRFEKQIAFMDVHPDVGVLGTWVLKFGDCKNHIRKRKKKVGLWQLVTCAIVVHPTTMLRKSLFDKYNLRYDPEYVACEDYDLWARASRYTTIANLQEVLLHYRWHTSNVSKIHRQIQKENASRVRRNILKSYFMK